MDKKYRIIYTNEKVILVIEDEGVTYLGKNNGHMMMVDTLTNAKTVLGSIGVNTEEIDNYPHE